MRNFKTRETWNSNRRTVCMGGLLVATGIVAYANSLHGPFVYDDVHAIVDNECLRTMSPFWQVLSAPPQSSVAGRPMVSLSLALNYVLSGLEVRGYHIFNISVHILASLVLFGIVRRTFLCPELEARWKNVANTVALVSALVWLVHPLQTESVDYVIQRTETIMGLFYLLTLYCAMRAMQSDCSIGWMLAAVLMCAAGMGSKETMVTAPVVVLLYDRVFWSSSMAELVRRRRFLYAGLAATWILLAMVMVSGPRSETVGFSLGVSWLDYALNQCVVLVEYFRLALWPSPLVFDYGEVQPIPFQTALPYTMVLVMILSAVSVTLFKHPMLGFLGLWVFVVLSPTSSFVPIGSEVGAERRMYLPLAALIVLAVLGGYSLLRCVGRGYTRRTVWWFGFSLSSLIVIALTCATQSRNHDYRETFSIWKTAVNVRPHNPRAHTNLGQSYQHHNKNDKAIYHYRRALNIEPKFAVAHNNLGVILHLQGKLDEALRKFTETIKIDPDLHEVHNNLGMVYRDLGQLESAISSFGRAVSIRGRSVSARINLGTALQMQGNTTEAVAQLKKCIELRPDLIEPYNNLGVIMQQQGNRTEGMRYFERALSINREDAETNNNMANALLSQGRHDEAMFYFEKSLESEPLLLEAHSGLAKILLVQNRYDKAAEHLKKSLEINPDLIRVLIDLGAVYAHQEKLERAMECFRSALEQRPQDVLILTNLGKTLHFQGRLDEAHRYLEDACYRAPAWAEVHESIGQVLQEMGHRGEAQSHLHAAESLRRNKDSERVH